jgi:uncharacterized protein (TIGR00288 family)
MLDTLLALVLLATLLYVMNALRVVARDRAERQAVKARTTPRVCVLIDGENIPSWSFARIEEVAGQLGRIAVCRVYADWGVAANGGWRTEMRRHGLESISVIPNVTGKNAVDITLALDAMEMLKDEVAEVFVFASSDSDFVPLYRRIRRSGRTVVVFGMPHAHASVRENANDFIVLRSPDNEARIETVEVEDVPALGPPSAAQEDDAQIRAAIVEAYEQVRDDQGWALVANLGNVLGEQGVLSQALKPGVSLTAFLRTTDLFEIDVKNRRTCVRLRRS